MILYRKLATLEADSNRGNERADGAEKKIRYNNYQFMGIEPQNFRLWGKSIEEGFRQKRRQRSSLLFGGRN